MGSIELVCPAGSPAMLHAAIEAGADSVYCGLRDETNARNFPGLNFDAAELTSAVRWAAAREAKVLVAINTFARPGQTDLWKRSVDLAVQAGAYAIIAADLGVLAYARDAHPRTRLHLSVQAAANSAAAIRFYAPEIASLVAEAATEIEAFVFGGLCIMAEGRCALSSYVTGRSPNLAGVCSPPEAVSFDRTTEALTTRLAGVAVDRIGPADPAGYPTLCKGRFQGFGTEDYLFEDPTSLNAMSLLADLRAAGVRAVKVEGRQRGKAYVSRVAAAFRAAIDALDRGEDTAPFERRLADLAEGGRETAGAYRKVWR